MRSVSLEISLIAQFYFLGIDPSSSWRMYFQFKNSLFRFKLKSFFLEAAESSFFEKLMTYIGLVSWHIWSKKAKKKKLILTKKKLIIIETI